MIRSTVSILVKPHNIQYIHRPSHLDCENLTKKKTQTKLHSADVRTSTEHTFYTFPDYLHQSEILQMSKFFKIKKPPVFGGLEVNIFNFCRVREAAQYLPHFTRVSRKILKRTLHPIARLVLRLTSYQPTLYCLM